MSAVPVRLVMDPIGMERIHDKAGDFAHAISTFILRDIIDDIPIDTGAMLRSLRLERIYAPRRSTKVWVGTNHWRFTEYGVPPHLITTRKRTMVNARTGERFGPVVHHPGVRAVAYMRRNLYKRRVIVREV